ncbi:glycosyltransferase family 92 protein RCOM_0530710 [Vitis vinifera]|uniref:Glycosyltransferase family 92 protein n=2 Tax=Vitis vinifera TaxID=29760 RepID=F6HPI8_VITVI|nr:glycosyltransferase family 92 protein RCOM_0530710 [Vitis vinifera]|eukprot:XP_002271877.2 PREDICTED: glycosyltransferase family 92 protein RCOM_0530710 [Vitis vinifera]
MGSYEDDKLTLVPSLPSLIATQPESSIHALQRGGTNSAPSFQRRERTGKRLGEKRKEKSVRVSGSHKRVLSLSLTRLTNHTLDIQDHITMKLAKTPLCRHQIYSDSSASSQNFPSKFSVLYLKLPFHQFMDSEQRRKRKRSLRASPSPHSHCGFSARSLILCLSFIFLLLLLHRFPIGTASFRPVVIVSTLSLLSSSTSNSIRDYVSSRLLLPLRVEDRVLFPDHVLLMVSHINDRSEVLECVYCKDIGVEAANKLIVRPVLSVDELDELRWVARCPLPPQNYSAEVNLRRPPRKESIVDGDEWLRRVHPTVHSWEMMAYAAALDRDSAVVFVKGLNLRPDRESDPRQFSCHFGTGDRERGGKFALTTRAFSAAQEVIRCSLPRSIRMNPSKAHGIRVTVGLNSHFHANARASNHVLVPSVAKMSSPKSYNSYKHKKNQGKYQLCVCTMVWNQASSLREWIMYHAWLGVERWFIYDNNSDDRTKEVIQELELEDYNVTRHTWPWIKTQEAGFSHCALRARDECNWVGFMDVDEFFYFPFPTHRRGSNKLIFRGQNSLRTLVANFSSTTIGEIRTACHSYGPSGLNSLPSQGVTVGYTCRLQSPERHKSIVRPDVLDRTLLNVVHHFRLRKGFKYLNLPQSTGVINHYKYQVWEAFRAKFFRRVATYVADWQEKENEGSKDRAPGLGTEAIEPPKWPLQFCEVWDTGLRDFVLANLADPTTGLLPWERSLL